VRSDSALGPTDGTDGGYQRENGSSESARAGKGDLCTLRTSRLPFSCLTATTLKYFPLDIMSASPHIGDEAPFLM
jgi:hypothetical protein